VWSPTSRRLRLLLGFVLGASLCLAPTAQAAAPDPRVPVKLPRPHPIKPLPPRITALKGRPMQAIFPFPVERHTLPNGLSVLFVPMASGGLVSYWTVVRTGSRDEVEPGVTGFAHFFEHMMFRGSKRFPAAVYDGLVKKIGADANAYTTDDYTAYHLSLAAEDLPTVIEIEADRFQHLDYEEAAFKTEAGAVYGEFRKGRTDPWEVLVEALQDTAFDKHTYKHTTIGFEADVMKMPEQYAYSKTFLSRFYRPENCVVMVVGDFDRQATLARIAKEYGAWSRGYVAPAVPEEPPQRGTRRVDVPFDGQTLPILALMWKGERFLPDDPTMVAAKHVGELALGETSPLYKKLVLEEQRLEALMGSFDSQRDPGLWGAFAVVKDPADAARIEAEITSAIAALGRDGVPVERLDAVRSRMKYAFLSGLESPAEVAQATARIVALTGDLEAIDRFYRTLDALTVDDVKRAVTTYLSPERLTVARVHTKGVALPQPLPAAPAPQPAPLGEAIVRLPVVDDPNVSVQVWIKAGSMNDPAGKEGLALLTASMLAEGGTERLPYDKILAALYPMAAAYGATVDKEMTVFTGHTHRDHADAFAQYFVDALVHPRFEPADFERIKASLTSHLENTLRYSSDEELGKAALYASIFSGTPYAHVGHGTVSALSRLTLDDVRAFWRKHLTRDSVVLGLGGSYTPAFEQSITQGLGVLPAGRPASATVKPAALSGRAVTIVQKDGPATAISFGFPIDVRRGSREFYALWLANSWLGEHRNSASHLFQVIREARGMNYGDYSYIEAFPEGGSRIMPPTGVGRQRQIFEVWIRPVPEEQAHFALRAALREVEKLADNGLTQAQFEATKNFLSKYVLHYADTTSRRLAYALDDRYYGLEGDGHLVRARKLLRELTLDDVNRAIRKHLRPADLWVAMVTQHAEELKRALATEAPSPISYPEGVTKAPEILSEDKAIATYPLRVSADRIRVVPVTQMFE